MRQCIAACLIPVLAWPCLAGADQPLVQGKPLDYWIKQLKDDDPLAREEALTVLADAGPAAAPALPALKDLQKDANPAVRLKTAIALCKIGRQDDATAGVLIDAVKGANRSDRLTALQALVRIDPLGKEALPALTAAFDDPDEQVHQYASAVLERMGGVAVPALAARLAEKDAALRRQCIDMLQHFGPAAKDAVPALKGTLKDADKSVRLAAAGTLLRLDPADADGAAALIDAVKDAETHMQAADMLLGVRPRPKAAGPSFAALLNEDAGIFLRLWAADALWDVDHQATEVLPVLTEAVRGKDANARRAALWSLARIGPPAKDALPDLMPLLNGGALTSEVTDVFRNIGQPAVPVLTDAAHAKQAGQFYAIHILAEMGADGAPALLKLLKDPDAQVRGPAVNALADMAPDAPGVVAALTEIAKDPKDDQRPWALAALSHFRSEDKTTAPLLLAALQEKKRASAVPAVAALRRMRLDPDAALPVLNQALQYVDRDLRADVIVLRWRADHKTGPAVDALKGLLSDKISQGSAMQEICRIAAEDSAAVPDAAAFLLHENASWRGEALQNLDRNVAGVKAAPDKVAEALKSSDAPFRCQVAWLLSEAGVDADEAVPVMVADLQSVRAAPANPIQASIAASRTEATLAALGRYGKQAAAAAPVVRDLLQSTIGPVRAKAAEALCQIAPDEKPAALAALREAASGAKLNLGRLTCAAALCRLDASNGTGVAILRAGLSDPDPGVRIAALAACGQAGPGARELSPLLEQALGQEVEGARMDAATALWKVGGGADKAAAALADALKEPAHTTLRTLAARRLAEMGADAKSAVPVLLETLQDKSPFVRTAAAESLRKIDAAAADKAAVP